MKILRQASASLALTLATIFLFACSSAPTPPTTAKPIPSTVEATSTPLATLWPTDEWVTGAPETERVDPDLLQKMEMHIVENQPHIRSVLIVRNGRLIYENYYQQDDPTRFHEIQSVGKSIISSLVGIAIAQGQIEGLEQPIMDFFPDDAPDQLHPQVNNITVGQLLTMTGGYRQCAQFFGCFPTEQENPVQFALTQPINDDGIDQFQYNNATISILLVEIVERATNRDIETFAQKNLCEPIGIVESCQQFFTMNYTFRPRDLAKFGYLYLHQGSWDTVQIIDSDWVTASTKQQNEGGFPYNEAYGFLFWVTTVESYHAYFAGGYGGQFLYVVPELDLVAVITSDIDSHHSENRLLVEQFIVPATQ